MLALLLAAAITTTPLKQLTSVGYDFPKKPDPKARYVIYVHGKLIEERGTHPRDPRFGVYEYADILQALSSNGLTVISEARPQNTDVKAFARHIESQIANLVKSGVPQGHITVIGASKGAVITMMVSTRVGGPKIRYVIMSNGNDEIAQRYKPKLHGEVLSIYDHKDEFGTTCAPIFAASKTTRHDEIKLPLGIGHALLYAPYPEWVTPAVAWAKR